MAQVFKKNIRRQVQKSLPIFVPGLGVSPLIITDLSLLLTRLGTSILRG